MSRLFAVTRARGPAWKPALPAEQQFDWTGHAGFMDTLYTEGFIALGGPLEGTGDVLIIVRANDDVEIRARFAWDSWAANDLLRITSIVPWRLRFGSLDRA
jgi:hypothetical protein